MKSTWGPPYRFLRLLPLNKPFFTISDPAFTEANKALEHAFTTDKETVRLRWARKGREQKSRKTTEDDLVLPQSLFWPTRSWVFWADEDSKLYQLRKTIRVSEILKMNPIPRYFLPLTMKLVSKGKGERAWKKPRTTWTVWDGVLVENNFDTTSVTWRSQFSAQYFSNCYVQVYN